MKAPTRLACPALIARCPTSTAALAEDNSLYSSVDERPGAGAMTFDLLAARPLGLAATALGFGVFVLQLPLAIVQEDGVRGPWESLVVTPAKYTFTRPLGSTE